MSVKPERPEDFPTGPDGVKVYPLLAISGGGADGAYGAGILCGWQEKTGKRPEFDIVTGVSTGALIAPAAFIGPEYDKLIRDIYTNITNADIAKQDFIQFFSYFSTVIGT